MTELATIPPKKSTCYSIDTLSAADVNRQRLIDRKSRRTQLLNHLFPSVTAWFDRQKFNMTLAATANALL
jgi:hypothetical protein